MTARIAIVLAALALGCGGEGPGPDGGDAERVSCDPAEVACRVLPPECPAAFAPSVEGTCWGPCVENTACARPIPCDESASDPCPAGWGCAAGECAPPR